MERLEKPRIFLSVFYFLSGLCFSSWASRIPTIKEYFGYNDAQLGTVLLSMPVFSLISLPISGWLITRFDSRKPMAAGFVLLSIAMVTIGFAVNTVMLVAGIGMFSFALRIINITMNTQALGLQKQLGRNINGWFHGLWSTGGIAGVGFSTLMIATDTSIHTHLVGIGTFTVLTALFCYRFLLTGDRAASGNKLMIGNPDPYIVYLGVLVFLAAVCEGGLFDWCSLYFDDVVEVELFTLGYLVFVAFMAMSRFMSDTIIPRIGMENHYIISSLLILTGISITILFPYFWPCMFGFCLAGTGVAAIFPMTFSLAGSSKKYSPGIAISIISTYSIVGMLLGPPLIGYISNAVGLRMAFIVFALAGFLILPVSQLFFRHKRATGQ